MEKQRGPAGRRLFVWLSAAWTLFIFLRSFQPAELSGRESGWILSLLLRLFPFPWLTDHAVRKAAHFTEFAILGLLSAPPGLSRPSLPASAHGGRGGSHKGLQYDCACPVDGGCAGSVPSRRTAAWLSLSLCGAAALCDETIQLFVEGRSGQVSDVWLDIGGAAFGLALALLLRRITARRAGRNTP